MNINLIELDQMIAHISDKTAVSAKMLRGEVDRMAMSEEWHDENRKLLHEDYWGKFILNYAQGLLEQEGVEFDEFWDNLNNHEFLEGSYLGKKLNVKLKSTAKKSLLYNIKKIIGQLDDDRMLEIDCVFHNKLQRVEAFSQSNIKRLFMLSLMQGFTQTETIIVDLGSGWGRYSTLFANNIGNAKIYSGELSESGRACTKLISEYFSLDIEDFYFNYQEWDGLLSIIRKHKDKQIVIFSNHSIEQVTYLNKQLFEDILSAGNDIQFLHLEPVGWQLVTEEDSLQFTKPPEKDLGENGGYNKNLTVILKMLQDEGKIFDLNFSLNHFALVNSRNCGTLISYRS